RPAPTRHLGRAQGPPLRGISAGTRPAPTRHFGRAQDPPLRGISAGTRPAPTRHFGRAQGPPLRLHLVRQRVVNGFEDEAPLVLARFRLAETSGPEPRALPREHVVERPSG